MSVIAHNRISNDLSHSLSLSHSDTFIVKTQKQLCLSFDNIMYDLNILDKSYYIVLNIS
jgi:hypothetical protein